MKWLDGPCNLAERFRLERKENEELLNSRRYLYPSHSWTKGNITICGLPTLPRIIRKGQMEVVPDNCSTRKIEKIENVI